MANFAEDFAVTNNPLANSADWKQLNAAVAAIEGSGQALLGQYVSELANANDQAACLTTPFEDDQFCEIRIPTFVSGSVRAGVVLRGSVGVSNIGWMVRYTGTNLEGYYFDQNGRNSIGGFAHTATVAGDTLRFEVKFDTVNIWRQAASAGDFVFVGAFDFSLSSPPAFDPGNSAPGLYIVENGTTQVAIDDFVAGDYGHYIYPGQIQPLGIQFAQSNAAPFTDTVDNPAGADFALVHIGFSAGDGDTVDTVTLDGQAGTKILEETSTAFEPAALFWVTGFTAGLAKTIAWTLSGGNPSTGCSVEVRYFSGVHQTTPIRDTDQTAISATGQSPTVNLTGLSVGDVCACFASMWTVPGTLTDGENFDGQFFTAAHVLSSLKPVRVGSTQTFTLNSGDYPAFFAVALAPAAVAAGFVGEVLPADAQADALPATLINPKVVNLTLKDRNSVLLPGETALHWAWFDEPDAAVIRSGALTAVDGGALESSDGLAVMQIEVDGSVLTSGQTGSLLLHNAARTRSALLHLDIA